MTVARTVVLFVVLCGLMACSTTKRLAVNAVGNAMAGGAGGVFASDNDPELIKEALPFGLKTYESLLQVSPKHRALLQSAAYGFTAYAYLLQQEADLGSTDVERLRHLNERASRLFLRGRDFALRGLEVSHPGITAELKREDFSQLAKVYQRDIAFLYWAGAAWAGAINVGRDDLALVAELRTAGALIERVLAIDESYKDGSAHEFFIAYEMSRPAGTPHGARAHFEKALAYSRGERASVYLSLAESVARPAQDVKAFRALLDEALDIDPDAYPEQRLVNAIAHRRALWLRTRIPELFVDAD